jgi:hypothetical protein
MWAYLIEFKNASEAGQISQSPHRSISLSYGSPFRVEIRLLRIQILIQPINRCGISQRNLFNAVLGQLLKYHYLCTPFSDETDF